MSRRLLLMIPLICLPLLGCAGRPSVVLGASPAAGPVVAVRDLKPSATPVTVQGRIIEKCPVAGCWFMLRDKTGMIKVDTKEAGFVVTDVPLNTMATVTGTFKEVGERRIAAAGMRY